MMSTLLAFHSRSGHTRQLAQAIAKQMNAELSEIFARENRKGILAYLRLGRDAWLGRKSEILPSGKNAADFDLVIIGTPIWSGSLSGPVRTYLEENASRFKNIAFFCTMGGSGNERAFHQMQVICRKAPLATLAITERQLANISHAESVSGFVTQLDLQMPRAVS
jgi:flavodoxin